MEIVLGGVEELIDKFRNLGELRAMLYVLLTKKEWTEDPRVSEPSSTCVGSSSSATVKSGDRVCIPHAQYVRLDENRKEMDGEDMGRCPVAAEM